MPHSLHTILRDIYDQGNSSFRILFESGGSSNAHSEWTIWKRIYDPDNSDIRVTGVGGITPVKMYCHLDSDREVSTSFDPIPWHVDREYGIDHTDGDAVITIPTGQSGDYMIMATVAVDYVAGETIDVEIQERS